MRKFTLGMMVLLGSGFISLFAKPEVKSQRLENNMLRLKVDGISGPNFPERAEARVDGKEIPKVEMSLSSPSIAILVDTSIGCQLEKVIQPIKQHLGRISKAIPPDSMISLIAYDSDKVQVLPAGRSDQFSPDALNCGPKRSLSLGDLFVKLSQENKTFDLLLGYTSGNIYLDEARAKALNSVAGRGVLVSYLARKADLGQFAQGIAIFSRENQQPVDQWLPAIEPDILADLGVTANLVLALPKKGLATGDYTVDIDFISKGKVASTTAVRIKYEKTRVRASEAFVMMMSVLGSTLGLLIAVGLYAYYRTPRCRRCNRPVLRRMRTCLFCLQYGDALLEIQDGNRTQVYPLRNRFVIGADRSADLHLAGPAKNGSFAIGREGVIYRVFTNHPKLRLNGKPIRGPRHLRSGDKISFGGKVCRFSVQKHVA